MASDPRALTAKLNNKLSSSSKRILREYESLIQEPSADFVAAPLPENIFEWHFTVRGPPATEFEGGVYHGRLILPIEYPLKPPSIIFMTPNGRFSVQEKICLSITDNHPETWSPAWGVRTVLEAIISLFPESGKNVAGIGYLQYPVAERRLLAKQSLSFRCVSCPLDGLVKILPDNVKKGASLIEKGSELKNPEIEQKHQKTLPIAKELTASGNSIKISRPNQTSEPRKFSLAKFIRWHDVILTALLILMCGILAKKFFN